MSDSRQVQILGTGCSKCQELAERSQEAVTELALDCEIVKITDIREIAGFGVMLTPALAIDGEVKSTGKLLTVEEIKQLLT